MEVVLILSWISSNLHVLTNTKTYKSYLNELYADPKLYPKQVCSGWFTIYDEKQPKMKAIRLFMKKLKMKERKLQNKNRYDAINSKKNWLKFADLSLEKKKTSPQIQW